MAKLGSDFRSTQPTDNDFVRHPTKPQMFTALRDLKSRIKLFFGTAMDLDTGDLLPGSVPTSSLRSLASDPSGTWRRVTVTAKGQVSGGDNELSETLPRVFRAIFFGDPLKTSTKDTVGGSEVQIPAVPGVDFDFTFWSGSEAHFSFQQFDFVVPVGVTRIKSILVGAGADDGSSEIAARQMDVAFSTTPGAILHIWAGTTNGAVSRISNAFQDKYVDSGGISLPTALDFPDVHVGWYGSSYRGYGVNGTPSVPAGTPGVVILEWYA